MSVRTLLHSSSRVLGIAGALHLCACASDIEAEPAPPCDQLCQDSNALRAVREGMKLIYNLTLQGKPVGSQRPVRVTGARTVSQAVLEDRG